MVEYSVIMRGPAVGVSGADPSVTGAVLIRLESSLRGAVDVAFRRSSASGRRQRWLRQAGQVEFKDAQALGKDELGLRLMAPRFGDVAQEYFSQPSLFEDGPHARDSAFDVLARAARDVLANRADSDRYDVGLLRRFHRLQASVFARGVDELVFRGHGKEKLWRLSPEFTNRARQLYVQTPEPARVRVAGRLDVIQASTLGFVMVLPGGDRVPGVWKGADFETLRVLVNSDVAASGMAIYRPSGSLLRIDADMLAPQRAADRLFMTLPSPPSARLDLKSLMFEQKKRGGMAAMWGKIPAEESDEEFLTAIAAMD